MLIWSLPDLRDSPDELPAPTLARPSVSLKSVSCSGSLVTFATTEGQLYLLDAAGDDAPRLVEALRSKDVASAACSPSGMVLVVTSAGSIYKLNSPAGVQEKAAQGNEKAAALMAASMLAAFGRLEQLPLPVQITRAACGREHSLLLSLQGLVFSFGEGRRGQLGLGNVQSASTPTCLEALAHLQASDIAAGSAHSCTVTTFGNVFTWGDNRAGQLGDGTQTGRDVPGLVGDIPGATAVAAAEASAVLAKNGSLWAWGFAGIHQPQHVFLGHRSARSLALSSQVLCCCTESGELLMVNLAIAAPGASSHQLFEEAWLAHDGVRFAAASSSCVVALCQDEVPERPKVPSSTPARPAPEALPGGRSTSAREAELAAANQRLERTIDELCAEHFLEISGLRGTSPGPRSEPGRILSGSSESGQVRDDERKAKLLECQSLHEELEQLMAAITRELPKQDPMKRPLAQAPASVLSRGVRQVFQASIKSLSSKHAVLAEETQQLATESEALKAEVQQMQAELQAGTSRLQRVEEATRLARGVAEQKRAEAEAALAQAAQRDEALKQELRLQQKVKLQDECRSCEQKKHQLLEEQAHEAAGIAKAQEAAWALERSESALQDAQMRVEKLRSDRDLTLQRSRAAEQQAKEALEARGQRAAELRRSCEALEAEEQSLKQALRDQALHFSECTPPLYAEVEALHEELAAASRSRSASVSSAVRAPVLSTRAAGASLSVIA